MLCNVKVVVARVNRHPNVVVFVVALRNFVTVQLLKIVALVSPHLCVIFVVVVVGKQKLRFAVAVKIHLSHNAKACEHISLNIVFAHIFVVCYAVFFGIFGADFCCILFKLAVPAVYLVCRIHNSGDDYDNNKQDCHCKDDDCSQPRTYASVPNAVDVFICLLPINMLRCTVIGIGRLVDLICRRQEFVKFADGLPVVIFLCLNCGVLYILFDGFVKLCKKHKHTDNY